VTRTIASGGPTNPRLRLRVDFLRLPALALLSALTAALGLAHYISTGQGTLATASLVQDNQLAAISERAERLQAYSRYIRKASHTGSSTFDMPFGGFVGSAEQVEPGAKLEIAEPGFAAQTLEVITVQKIPTTIQLATITGRDIELVLVSGRISGAQDGRIMQFLVAVNTAKPGNTAPDLRTL
jgi:hypothetical protein